jgi:hypothetical protein
MAIARRPRGETVTPDVDDNERERREQAFLAGATDAPKTVKSEDTGMQTVHLRFESEMLTRIDSATKEMGLGSRAAWVRFAVMQTLKDQGK